MGKLEAQRGKRLRAQGHTANTHGTVGTKTQNSASFLLLPSRKGVFRIPLLPLTLTRDKDEVSENILHLCEVLKTACKARGANREKGPRNCLVEVQVGDLPTIFPGPSSQACLQCLNGWLLFQTSSRQEVGVCLGSTDMNKIVVPVLITWVSSTQLH